MGRTGGSLGVRNDRGLVRGGGTKRPSERKELSVIFPSAEPEKVLEPAMKEWIFISKQLEEGTMCQWPAVCMCMKPMVYEKAVK